MESGAILITGASSGLGRALAVQYATQAQELFLVARREKELNETKVLCLQSNPNCKVTLLTADVSDIHFIDALSALLSTCSNLKLVYVNAGVGSAGSFRLLKVQDFQRAFSINTMGALYTIYGSLPALEKSKGRIVLIGSMNSHLPLPLGLPYNMSKFAVRALAETLQIELNDEDIKVSIIYPGPIKTNIMAIDNSGNFHQEAKDYFSHLHGLAPEVAARKIEKKVDCGKREIYLTFFDFIIVMFNRLFPNLSKFLMRAIFQLYKAKFQKLVAKVNPDSVERT